MNILSLFIDELGSAERNESFSKHYILVGCLANKTSREMLKLRQIKSSLNIGEKQILYSIQEK